MATKLEFLVAKEKMLVALATVSVAISSPEGSPMKKHEEAKPKEKNTKQNKTKQYRVHFIGFPVFL